MASIWSQERGDGSPKKIVGGMSDEAAVRQIRQMVASWRHLRGPVMKLWDHEYLLFDSYKAVEERKPRGSLYVELLSPPSSPEPGSSFHAGPVKRPAKAKRAASPRSNQQASTRPSTGSGGIP